MKKILIVDDAPTVLKIVQFTLEDEGFAVTKANGPEEAQALIARETFDLGIFDVNMPGMTGIELTAKVLAMPNGRNLKILILTTESGDAIRAAGKAAGAKGWLTKPFQNSDLIGAVRALAGP